MRIRIGTLLALIVVALGVVVWLRLHPPKRWAQSRKGFSDAGTTNPPDPIAAAPPAAKATQAPDTDRWVERVPAAVAELLAFHRRAKVDAALRARGLNPERLRSVFFIAEHMEVQTHMALSKRFNTLIWGSADAFAAFVSVLDSLDEDDLRIVSLYVSSGEAAGFDPSHFYQPEHTERWAETFLATDRRRIKDIVLQALTYQCNLLNLLGKQESLLNQPFPLSSRTVEQLIVSARGMDEQTYKSVLLMIKIYAARDAAVRQELRNVYLDPNSAPELRTTALVSFAEGWPSRETVAILGNAIHNETDPTMRKVAIDRLSAFLEGEYREFALGILERTVNEGNAELRHAALIGLLGVDRPQTSAWMSVGLQDLTGAPSIVDRVAWEVQANDNAYSQCNGGVCRELERVFAATSRHPEQTRAKAASAVFKLIANRYRLDPAQSLLDARGFYIKVMSDPSSAVRDIGLLAARIAREQLGLTIDK